MPSIFIITNIYKGLFMDNLLLNEKNKDKKAKITEQLPLLLPMIEELNELHKTDKVRSNWWADFSKFLKKSKK